MSYFILSQEKINLLLLGKLENLKIVSKNVCEFKNETQVFYLVKDKISEEYFLGSCKLINEELILGNVFLRIEKL